MMRKLLPNLSEFRTLDNVASRRVNSSIVLNLIRERQPISRAELARATELRGSTISSITKQLIGDGLVYEAAVGKSGGGRRPRLLRLNGRRSVAVGVHLGVQETIIGLSNFSGEIISKRVFKTNKEPAQFVPMLVEELASVIGSQISAETQLEGIGMALSGVTDPTEGKIIYSSNLEWRNVEVGKALRKRFSCPLFFEDDARAAGLGELWFGGYKNLKFRHFVSVTVNEGVGTAIFVHGRLYIGASLGAGQFGHISLDPRGPVCPCGNRGCWEVYASDTATVHRYVISSPPRSGKAAQDVKISDVVQRALAGEDLALNAVRETGRYLGRGAAILVNALNPEMVIFNGQITGVWPLIKEDVWRELRSSALSPALAGLNVCTSSIQESLPLMGALSLVLGQDFLIQSIA